MKTVTEFRVLLLAAGAALPRPILNCTRLRPKSWRKGRRRQRSYWRLSNSLSSSFLFCTLVSRGLSQVDEAASYGSIKKLCPTNSHTHPYSIQHTHTHIYTHHEGGGRIFRVPFTRKMRFLPKTGCS